jgi:hypothetical protein
MMRYPLPFLACVLFLLALTTAAQAQSPPNRTWVATTAAISDVEECVRVH